jgi:hypothetical protein
MPTCNRGRLRRGIGVGDQYDRPTMDSQQWIERTTRDVQFSWEKKQSTLCLERKSDRSWQWVEVVTTPNGDWHIWYEIGNQYLEWSNHSSRYFCVNVVKDAGQFVLIHNYQSRQESCEIHNCQRREIWKSSVVDCFLSTRWRCYFDNSETSPDSGSQMETRIRTIKMNSDHNGSFWSHWWSVRW